MSVLSCHSPIPGPGPCPRLLGPRFASLVLLGLLLAQATSLAAQDAPRAIPSAIELTADGGRAQVDLRGPDVGAFRAVRLVGPRGAGASGLRVELGETRGDLRMLTIVASGAAAGDYRVLLEGARGPVEVALRITVAAAAAKAQSPTGTATPAESSAPPEIVAAEAPASLETGTALSVGLLIRSSAALVALEWEWDGRRDEMRLGGGTEAREELRLEAPTRPGRATLRLVAVDANSRRSEARELVVDVVAPAPIPRIEILRLEPATVAAGDAPMLRLRLDVPAPEPLEIPLTGQPLHDGIHVVPPPMVTVPAGEREVEVPVTFTAGDLLPGAHPFTIRADLNGTESRAEGSVVGTPFVERISVPAWVLAGDEVTVEVHLTHPAPPGGAEVEVRIPQTHNYTSPWGAVMVAAEGQTRLAATTTLQHDQPSTLEVSWQARTAAHGTQTLPAQATHAVYARPRVQTLNLTRFDPITEPSRGALVALAAPAPPGGVDVALEVVPAGVLAVPATVRVPPTATSSGFQVELLAAPVENDVEVVIRATVLGGVVERTVVVAAAGG